MNDLHVSKLTSKNRLKQVEEQFRSWELADGKSLVSRTAKGTRFVTISREYGCAGFRIGDTLTEVLNSDLPPGQPKWTVYDRKLVDEVCHCHSLSRVLVESLDEQRKYPFSDYITGLFTGEPSTIQIFKKCAESIFQLASNGRVILIGRASSLITNKLTGGLHVRIIAPLEWRVKQVAAYENISRLEDSRKLVEKMDKERGKYAKDFLGKNLKDPAHYDLIFNQQTLGVEGIVQLILQAMAVKQSSTGQTALR